jgi:hypothetical protein
LIGVSDEQVAADPDYADLLLRVAARSGESGIAALRRSLLGGEGPRVASADLGRMPGFSAVNRRIADRAGLAAGNVREAGA